MNNQTWPFANPVDPNIYSERKDWPKISIVTPSYNQGQYIEETILSILNQNYPNLEYIIIDGSSIDNTVEIIKKYEDRITYWISEKDNGQADAINKGLKKCTGEIFNWINSDDYLTRQSLYEIAMHFDPKKVDALAGSVINFDVNSSSRKVMINKNLDILSLISINKFSIKDAYNYHQPGVWLNFDKMAKIGYFDASLRYTFDFDYMLRYLDKHNSVEYLNQPLVFFRLHETSKTVSENIHFKKEFIISYQKFFEQTNSSRLKSKVHNTLITKKWHDYISNLCNKKKLQVIIEICTNVVKDPRRKLTRITIGRLKLLIFSAK